MLTLITTQTASHGDAGVTMNRTRALLVTVAVSTALLVSGCKAGMANPEPDSSSQARNAIFAKGELLSSNIITGRAWHNRLVEDDATFTTVVGVEQFEPGARNVWHSHPGGQILIVTNGVGYHQIRGGPIQIVRKGDVVKCPPGVAHWHGASRDTGVTQIYILPNTDKGIVTWLERVSDEQYNSAQ